MFLNHFPITSQHVASILLRVVLFVQCPNTDWLTDTATGQFCPLISFKPTFRSLLKISFYCSSLFSMFLFASQRSQLLKDFKKKLSNSNSKILMDSYVLLIHFLDLIFIWQALLTKCIFALLDICESHYWRTWIRERVQHWLYFWVRFITLLDVRWANSRN